ncbi:hypothetical protein Pan241w_11180 [Gimesia alba]|uniref:Uncharacterized protein n=1 Tax=Gimesia alba TaxID=2527973 RepID=A0A517RAZ9_9PLAN|nr:hypothetical protein [Gimesia alba]QDT41059.1 hypothetical protein Pan241w_11180 [Gimesia alba]
MIAAAEAERNVAITLQLVSDPRNPSTAKVVRNQVEDVEKIRVKAAKRSKSEMDQVARDEQREREYNLREQIKAAQKEQREKDRLEAKAARDREQARKREEREKAKAAKAEEREHARLEKEKTRKAEREAKQRESIFKREALEIKRYQEKIQRETENAQRQRVDGSRRATEASVGALQGVMDLVEGTAILGLTSEENFEKFAKTFIKIQAGFKAMKGFTELVWKGREAIVALRESQEALRTSQVLLSAAPVPAALAATAAGKATLAGGGSGGGSGIGGFAASVGAEAAGGVISGRMVARRAAKEAAEAAAEKAAQKTAGRVGGGFANEFFGSLVGSMLFNSGAGKAVKGVGRRVLGRVGGATIGGVARGTGRLLFRGGRALIGSGKAALGRLGGTSLAGGGMVALGGALGYGLSELLSYTNSLSTGRKHGSEPPGPQRMGFGNYFKDLFDKPLYNESPTGAFKSTYKAVSDMFSSDEAVEKRQKELDENKIKNQEIRERQRDRLSFRLSQDSAYSGLNRQRIALGPGTDIEKAKKLEIQAAAEVAQAKAAAQENYQKQIDAMNRNEAYNDELRLMHLENVSEKQAQLVDAARSRLDLLKAQNKEHESAVKSAKEQLKAAKEQVTVAEKAVASDRESKLAQFDKLADPQKRNLRSIADKVNRGERLSFREVKQLEETPFGGEIAQKYRAQRSAGDAGTIRALGGFKDAEKNLADARTEENKKRAELSESIRKERESRDAMIVQTNRVKRSMESLSAIVDKVARASAEQAGVEYTPPPVVPQQGAQQVGQRGGSVVGAVNNATDSFVQEHLALIEALKNFKDTNSESFRQLREQLTQQDQRGADYRSVLQGGP